MFQMFKFFKLLSSYLTVFHILVNSDSMKSDVQPTPSLVPNLSNGILGN